MNNEITLACETSAELAVALADAVVRDLNAAIEARGNASLALSGGSTPKLFLRELGQRDIDWQKVYVTLADERLVGEEHPRSNMRFLRENFLGDGANGGANDGGSVSVGAASVGAASVGAAKANMVDLADAAAVGAMMPLDVCVLGMGDDMHTASLFPGADGTDAAICADNADVTARISPAGGLEPRLSLTANMLRRAASVYLLIHGEGKREALARALAAKDEAESPVRIVLCSDNPAKVYWAPN